MRKRPSSGAQVSLIAAYAAALSLTTPSFAKTPGEVHCYNGICHRVKTVAEMALIVGSENDSLTSFYDTAERDSMNTGTITSSGEEFDADSDGHAASSLYPDGTELLIWNPKNRHAAHIRVNDFGPFYMMRTIDVTRRVAEKLEFTKSGVARLKVAVVWAPSADAARYRRNRSYPAVEGHLGQIDYDQFVSLKTRLIATAAERNAAKGTVAKVPTMAPAAASLKVLPAYAGPASTPADRRLAAVLNVPRFTLNAAGPALTLTQARGGLPVRSLASAQAMAAANPAELMILASRDGDLADAVAAVNGPASVAVAALAPVLRAPAAEPFMRTATFETSTGGKPWAPNTLLWQQLLAALGFLTVATVGWRTRTVGGRVQVQARATMPVGPVPVAFSSPATESYAPFAPVSMADNVISLPMLPRVPTKSMEALRDEAIAHMEAYAYGAAEAAYRKLLSVREETLGADSPMTANAERQLADCLREQGRYAAAEPHYVRALNTMMAIAGEGHPATADILDEYAVSLLRQGRGAEAERTARRALSARRAAGPQSREYAGTLSIVAEALRAQGQLGGAEAEHRTAWSHFIALSGQDGLDAAASMTSIGTVLGEMGRFGPAEDLLNAGTRILSSVCGDDHPVTATGYALLGDLYRRAGALDAARTMQTYALDIRERKLGERHPDTIETLLSLSLIATEQYRIEDARGLLGRALDSLIAGERNHMGPQSRVRMLLVSLSHHHDVSTPQRLAAE